MSSISAIIENKNNDAKASKKKDVAWDEIKRKFKAKFGEERSGEEFW